METYVHLVTLVALYAQLEEMINAQLVEKEDFQKELHVLLNVLKENMKMLIHKNVNYVMQPAKNVKEKLLINVQVVLMDYSFTKDHV